MSRDPFIGGNGPKKNPFDDIFQKNKEDEEKEKLLSKKKEKDSSIQRIVTKGLKRFINLLGVSSKKTISKPKAILLEEDLEKLKKAFKNLKNQDLSQSRPFLKELSLVWLDFLKSYHTLYPNKKSHVVQDIEKLNKAISSYPEHEENSMGFYLSEYAGQDWLPFPYMEILRKLHTEDTETLQKWINLIDEIIVDIKKRRPIS